jgi:inner membrane protein
VDNLTHTLIGALAGETLTRATTTDERGLPANVRRSLFVTLAALASNLPDIDLIYSFVGGKVNYLLHHRGHSHTIVGALFLAVLVYAATQWWLRRRGLSPSATDQAWLAAIVFVAPLLHIAMDATNDYGVHPFWPVDNRWHYGDSMFIAEPLLWAACAPLLFLLRTLTARVVVVSLVATALVLLSIGGVLPPAVAGFWGVVMAAMLGIGRWAPPRVALIAGIVLWAATTLTFIVSSHVAGKRVATIAARDFPKARLLDHVLTAMPSNPLCWQVLLVQTQDDALALRRAVLSLAPGRISAAQCDGARATAPTTAPLESVAAQSDAQIAWHGEVLTPLRTLSEWAATNCNVAAALRFVRAPWLASIQDVTIFGDLRYDREETLGFAELAVTPDLRCPAFVPGWQPPRSDVLGEEVSG